MLVSKFPNSFFLAQKPGLSESLGVYIHQALSTFLDVLKNGIPEFGIPPLEPVKLNNMSLNGSSGGVTINSAIFTNVTLFGLSTMQVSKVQVRSGSNPNIPTSMNLQLKFENWTLYGNYNMFGKVIGIIPLKGNGKMEMELIGVIIDAVANLTVNPNGTFTIKQNDLNLDISTDSVHTHFHGLYGGGTLSGFANKIANFFSGRIFNSAKPKLIEKMTQTL